ncbi:hypothetical protein [Chitinilyticum aquatile]|nr:hypothetical protein [Chitinilyticum aquatile]
MQELFNPELALSEQVTCWSNEVLRRGAPDNLSIILATIQSSSADH